MALPGNSEVGTIIHGDRYHNVEENTSAVYSDTIRHRDLKELTVMLPRYSALSATLLLATMMSVALLLAAGTSIGFSLTSGHQLID